MTFDFDRIMEVLSGLPPYQKNANLVGLVGDIRNLLVEQLSQEDRVEDAWIIVTRVDDEFKAQLSSLEAEYILMETPKDECLDRIQKDPDRAEVAEELTRVVEDWFSEFSEQPLPENTGTVKPILENSSIKKGGETMPLAMSHKGYPNQKHFWQWSTTNVAGAPKNAAVRTLLLDGYIAEDSWFDDEITPKAFKEELYNDGRDSDIIVKINSPGGDCFAAAQIYNMLKEHPGNVEVHVDGIAASAASVIAMAGDSIRVSPVSIIMIHNPAMFVGGEASDLEVGIHLLNEVKESIINAYEAKTGLSRVKLAHMMDAETWMSAHKAIELGFADAMLYWPTPVEEERVANSFMFDTLTVTNTLAKKLPAHWKNLVGIPEPSNTATPSEEEEATPVAPVVEEESIKEDAPVAPAEEKEEVVIPTDEKPPESPEASAPKEKGEVEEVENTDSGENGKSVTQLLDRLDLIKNWR